jgi:hypothetical protein
MSAATSPISGNPYPTPHYRGSDVDIIERAEVEWQRYIKHGTAERMCGYVPELIVALKAARAENERLLKFIEKLTPAKLRAIDEGRA